MVQFDEHGMVVIMGTMEVRVISVVNRFWFPCLTYAINFKKDKPWKKRTPCDEKVKRVPLTNIVESFFFFPLIFNLVR